MTTITDEISARGLGFPDHGDLDDPYQTCEYGHHTWRLIREGATPEECEYRCDDCGSTDPEGDSAPVKAPCYQCHSHRRMDDLHRIHIVRLTRQVAEERERLRPAQEALEKLHARFQRMRLICYAGWFLAGLLATGDVIGWGR